MKRLEAVVTSVAAFLMLAAGLAWQFGSYGLIGAGAAAFIGIVVFFDWKNEEKE